MEQNNFQLQLICYAFMSHIGYIFWIEDWKLGEWKTTGR